MHSRHLPTSPAVSTQRRYWLLKSEPDTFSYADLAAAGRAFWDGVRNYQARNLLRDEIAVGDGVLFYHSSSEPSGVAGVARVVVAGEVDPTQFDPRDPHHDPKSDPDEPRWFGVTIEAVAEARPLLPLAEIRRASELAGMALVRPGQRLSVQPVSAAEWRAVLRRVGLGRAVRW